MTDIEKVLQLFSNTDTSNHYLALALIRSQELDLELIVRTMVNDKKYWQLYPGDFNSSYGLCLFNFVFTLIACNPSWDIYYTIYIKGNFTNKHYDNQNITEEEIIQSIITALNSI